MTGQWAAERAAADLLTELDLEEPSTKRAPSIRLVKVMEGRRERRRKRRERSEVWRIRCPPILCWSIHVYKYSTHLCVCVIFSSGVSGFPRWGRLMRPDSPYNSLAAYLLVPSPGYHLSRLRLIMVVPARNCHASLSIFWPFFSLWLIASPSGG